MYMEHGTTETVFNCDKPFQRPMDGFDSVTRLQTHI